MSVNLPQRVGCEISARREERETGKKLPGFNICCHDSAIEDILRLCGQATAQLNVIGPRKREKKLLPTKRRTETGGTAELGKTVVQTETDYFLVSIFVVVIVAGALSNAAVLYAVTTVRCARSVASALAGNLLLPQSASPARSSATSPPPTSGTVSSVCRFSCTTS